MSLINDALKKAQRQRTGDSPLSHAPMPGGSPSRPAGGNGINPQVLLLGAGAIIGLLIATGAVLFLREKPAAPAGAVSAPVPVAESPAKPGAEPAVAAARPPEVKTPATSATPEPSAANHAAPPPVASMPVVKTEPPPVAAAKSEAPATIAPAAHTTPEKPSPKMIEAVEALHVAGIRAGTGTDAKVLMNDRVYRLGDTVDHALGLKLTAATATSLTFQDATGASYTRNF